jgi:mRNA-degrading endonuclease RelE of RelBE toxin-antitoxin system
MKKHKSSHLWYLRFEVEAQMTFNTLSSSEKLSMFRHLRTLLISPDPYRVSGVEMPQEKALARVRKFRVGNYRVFFYINPEEITILKYVYKGELFVLAIRNRKDAY